MNGWPGPPILYKIAHHESTVDNGDKSAVSNFKLRQLILAVALPMLATSPRSSGKKRLSNVRAGVLTSAASPVR